MKTQVVYNPEAIQKMDRIVYIFSLVGVKFYRITIFRTGGQGQKKGRLVLLPKGGEGTNTTVKLGQ